MGQTNTKCLQSAIRPCDAYDLCLFIAALIQGNHSNCTQFASSQRIDWLIKRLLESQQSSQGTFCVVILVI